MDTAALILRRWLPIAVVVVAICGLVYLAVQQSLRQNANDPQIQMAEDAASALAAGTAAETFLPGARIDIGQSLAPFLIFYSDGAAAVASSGVLHDQVPVPPLGVFDYVRQHGEERVTWQPERGVRIASVIIRTRGPIPGYVLAGRSLREVEKRELQVQIQAGVALAASLAVSLAVVALGELVIRSRTIATA
jgi:hypothetical protein